MKKYSYPIIITSLVCMLFISMYLLYSNNKQEEIAQEKLISNKTVDIKENIEKRKNMLLGYKVKEVDSRDLDMKMSKLKTMLEKTQVMLKEYNDTHPEKIIDNQEVDKLVNLDLNQDNLNIANNENIPLEKNDLENKKEENLNSKNVSNNSTNNYMVSSSTKNSSAIYSSPSTQNKVNKSISTNNNSNVPDSGVSDEVSKLQMQIDDVKKVITQVSSNIN